MSGIGAAGAMLAGQAISALGKNVANKTSLTNNALSNLTSIANAQNSNSASASRSKSISNSSSVADSWGSSSSSAYNLADSWGWSDAASQEEGGSYGYSNGEGWEEGEGASWGNEYSRTYGSQASAKDIQNAAMANKVQRDLWSDQAAYNAQQAQIDREFQKYMSNTAYQRAVLDLMAAGLNPILAVGNMGASTPVGAMASSGLASAFKANAYADSESGGSSGSYSRNSGRSYSKSENSSYNRGSSYSRSENGSHSEGASSSSSSEGSHSQSNSSSKDWSGSGSMSSTTTQLKDMVGIVGNLVSKSGSAKSNNGRKQTK